MVGSNASSLEQGRSKMIATAMNRPHRNWVCGVDGLNPLPDDCSPALQRAVDAAERWRTQLADHAWDRRHLLLALLEDDEARPALLFARFGLPATVVLAQATRLRHEPFSGTLEALVQEVIRSTREAISPLAVDRTVTSERFLVGLLRSAPQLTEQLGGLGLQWPQLVRQVFPDDGPQLETSTPVALTDPTETHEAARILDASANRAREALRVIDDFCRFVLDDAVLTREAKSLRHELNDALQLLPAPVLLASRDTLGDVGTRISTATEKQRHHPREVVRINLKRFQEAMRSLEEFGKLFQPTFAERLEQLRYRSYTLERAILRGSTARDRLSQARLYALVTGSQCEAALDWTVREMLAGGVDIVQLREKHLSDRELLQRARLVRRLTREAQALFLVNDRPDMARLSEADGVHLGQDDLPVADARKILGAEAIIGVSTHRIEQIRQAVLDGADYLGIGPMFPSQTKAFDAFPGLDFARAAVRETTLPLFAIGGIDGSNVARLLEVGVRRIAVSAALCRASDPRAAASALREQLLAADQRNRTQGT